MPTKILTITVPNDPVQVITIRVPGAQGPGGLPGPPGPSSVLSIGTVTSLAAGASATATISGVSPTQTLNLGIPRGNTGATGPPANLTIGTITTSAPGGNGAATITGTAPDYTLNLTLPRGYGVASGGVANQVLNKTSSTDYDTNWLSHTDASTANTLVRRDASGNFAANLIVGNTAPSATNHLTRKDYVDAQVATRAATTHTHTASQISDSTTVGRSVITATDAPAARSAIGAGTSNLALGTTSSTAKAGDYQPTAANISDSTAVGRSVLTATDAPAARSAIGAGTSSLVLGTTSTTAKAGDYTPASASETVSGISRFATSSEITTGTSTTLAVHAAGLKSVADTKAPLSHTHTSTQISDSTATGRSLLTATDAAAARAVVNLPARGSYARYEFIQGQNVSFAAATGNLKMPVNQAISTTSDISYNSTSNNFTINRSGLWLFSMGYRALAINAGGFRFLCVLSNSDGTVTYVQSMSMNQVNIPIDLTMTQPVYLNSGDVVSAQIYHNANQSISLDTSSANFASRQFVTWVYIPL